MRRASSARPLAPVLRRLPTTWRTWPLLTPCLLNRCGVCLPHPHRSVASIAWPRRLREDTRSRVSSRTGVSQSPSVTPVMTPGRLSIAPAFSLLAYPPRGGIIRSPAGNGCHTHMMSARLSLPCRPPLHARPCCEDRGLFNDGPAASCGIALIVKAPPRSGMQLRVAPRLQTFLRGFF